MADFDRDGDLDLAIATSFPNDSAIAPRIGLLTNDGTGAFSEAKEFLLEGQALLGFGHIVAADFDADGWLDLASGSGSSLSLLSNDHAGGFVVSQLTGLTRVVGLEAADLDGNGSVDLAMSGNVGDMGDMGEVGTLINDGHGAFTLGAHHMVAPSSCHNIGISDLDGDTFPEIAVANPKAKGVSVLRNRGDGTFEDQRLLGTGAAHSLLLADFNGDSWVDMAVAGIHPLEGMVVLSNDRHGGFVTGERFSALPYDMPIALTSGDFNEDGAPDVATAGDSRPLMVWLNAGAAP